MIINPSSLDRQQPNELVNKVTTCSIKVCQQCCHPVMSHADRVSRGTTLAAAAVVVADVAAGHDDHVGFARIDGTCAMSDRLCRLVIK